MKEILKTQIIDDLCNTKFTGTMVVKFINGEVTEVSRQPEEISVISNIKSIISFWQMRFRVLHDWIISYEDHAEYKNQCHFNIETKQAVIYEWTNIDNQINDIKKYILHEVSHIAYEASRNDKDLNELFTQDITNMLNYYNKM